MTALVDVLLVSYNHEEYIAQAIEGVLMQKTPFAVHIRAADDLSTDRTRQIIEKYRARYPDKITTIFPPDHRGVGHPDYPAVVAARGITAPYVAILEGDDFWSDELKLQRQIEFLETNPDCSICFHPVTIHYSGSRKKGRAPVYGRNGRRMYSLEEILQLGQWPELPTASLLARSQVLRTLPPWFASITRGDTALQMLYAATGRIGCIPQEMAVHRKHDAGVSSLLDIDPDFMRDDLLRAYAHFDEYTSYRFHEALKPRLSVLWREKAESHAARGEDRRSVTCMRLAEFSRSSTLSEQLELFTRQPKVAFEKLGESASDAKRADREEVLPVVVSTQIERVFSSSDPLAYLRKTPEARTRVFLEWLDRSIEMAVACQQFWMFMTLRELRRCVAADPSDALSVSDIADVVEAYEVQARALLAFHRFCSQTKERYDHFLADSTALDRQDPSARIPLKIAGEKGWTMSCFRCKTGKEIRRDETGVLFDPGDLSDHIATDFVSLPSTPTDKWIRLVVRYDLKAPSSERTRIVLQDDGYNDLDTITGEKFSGLGIESIHRVIEPNKELKVRILLDPRGSQTYLPTSVTLELIS